VSPFSHPLCVNYASKYGIGGGYDGDGGDDDDVK
jgi:hypothetical protein